MTSGILKHLERTSPKLLQKRYNCSMLIVVVSPVWLGETGFGFPEKWKTSIWLWKLEPCISKELLELFKSRFLSFGSVETYYMYLIGTVQLMPSMNDSMCHTPNWNNDPFQNGTVPFRNGMSQIRILIRDIPNWNRFLTSNIYGLIWV